MGNKIGRAVGKQNVELIKVRKINQSINRKKAKISKRHDAENEEKQRDEPLASTTENNSFEKVIDVEITIAGNENKVFVISKESEKYAMFFSENVLKDAFLQLQQLIMDKLLTLKKPSTTQLKVSDNESANEEKDTNTNANSTVLVDKDVQSTRTTSEMLTIDEYASNLSKDISFEICTKSENQRLLEIRGKIFAARIRLHCYNQRCFHSF